MGKRRLDIQSWLETDITPFLLTASLIICGIGWIYGFIVALKTFAALFVALLILAVPVLIWSGDRTERSRLLDLREIYGGSVSRDWHRLGRQRLEFPHRRATVSVWFNYPGRESFRKTYVHVEVNGPIAQVQMEILPHGIRSIAKRILGSRVKCEESAFEEDFDVFGEPVQKIEEWLTKPVHGDIRSLNASGLLQIRVSGHGMSVVATDEQIGKVAQATLSLYGRLRPTVGEQDIEK